jgi:hypothetical protein
MNPVLAALLAELEAKGMQVAQGVLVLVAKDLLSGKSIVDTATDLGMTAAEDLAALEDRALKAAGL